MQRDLFPLVLGTPVGFTGTQRGMTDLQRQGIHGYLRGFGTTHSFAAHHGDCIGADADFHRISVGLLACNGVVVHPPTVSLKRAFCDWGAVPVHVLQPRPYLERNRHIVEDCEIMLATPGEREEQLRSGTWATIRHAKKSKRRLRIYWPDGGFADFNGGG